MSIIRIKKNKEYFAVSNAPFNDDRLSWEARGVIGYLLSKPDDWTVRFYDLVNSGPAGDYKMRRILKELEDCGYLVRERVKNKDGTFDWQSIIYEKPTISRLSIYGASIDGSPTCGVSIDGKPRDIVSTELTSTDIKKTELEQPPVPSRISPDAMFCRVTNMAAFPGTQLQYVNTVQAMLETFGEERTEKAMRNQYTIWRNSRRKDGSGNYRGTNLAWIDWAQEELAASPSDLRQKEPKDMTSEEWEAYVLALGEQA